MSVDDQELSLKIRRHASRYRAPPGLCAKILTQVALDNAERTTRAVQTRARRAWFGLGFGGAAMNWRPASVGFALGLACAVIAFPVAQRVSDVNRSMDAELVVDHVRALRSGPLTQVVSTDRNTVKPWFQGRLEYAPPVFDLADEGFPLRGGRIERVEGNVVATLAYSRDLHMIDLFVWPTETRRAPVRSVHLGFNVLHWADGSMQYWAVSDVESAELARFAERWQARIATQ